MKGYITSFKITICFHLFIFHTKCTFLWCYTLYSFYTPCILTFIFVHMTYLDYKFPTIYNFMDVLSVHNYKLCSVELKLVYFSQFWGMKHSLVWPVCDIWPYKLCIYCKIFVQEMNEVANWLQEFWTDICFQITNLQILPQSQCEIRKWSLVIHRLPKKKKRERSRI